MAVFGRQLHLGSKGDDVLAVKRALSRAGYGRWSPFTKLYGAYTVVQVKRFQKKHGIPQSGVYGQATHRQLAPHFDAYGRFLYAPPNLPLLKAAALLDVCRTFTGPYVWGGGHGILRWVKVSQGLDCSSSTSKALSMVGLFSSPWAWVSGAFERWGVPGRGRYVTVHANYEHVWIEFHLPGGYYRFDTSPHGNGPRGPRVRRLPRSSLRFIHRHPKGL